ncbi:MAG: alpha/beta hydrolase-fold protein [Kofleriaceae bacterium]
MRALLVVVAACGGSLQEAPPPPELGTQLGETLTLHSKVLGETRVINVYLPPQYEKGADKFPVLYIPDGGMAEDFPHVVGTVDTDIKNAVIRPIIVVGIENTERRRDLAGTTDVPDEQKVAPHAGGSDTFRTFLRDELKPMIAKTFRTTGESALMGESLAGLFAIETFLVEPGLFDDYISVDPSVWWNQGRLVDNAPASIANWTKSPKLLYVATGDYKDTQDGVKQLGDQVRIAGTVQWIYEPMPAEHHNTIYAIAAIRGVRAAFGL